MEPLFELFLSFLTSSVMWLICSQVAAGTTGMVEVNIQCRSCRVGLQIARAVLLIGARCGVPTHSKCLVCLIHATTFFGTKSRRTHSHSHPVAVQDAVGAKRLQNSKSSWQKIFLPKRKPNQTKVFQSFFKNLWKRFESIFKTFSKKLHLLLQHEVLVRARIEIKITQTGVVLVTNIYIWGKRSLGVTFWKKFHVGPPIMVTAATFWWNWFVALTKTWIVLALDARDPYLKISAESTVLLRSELAKHRPINISLSTVFPWKWI